MALSYREITGLWSARVPDGPDSDQHPDTILLEGHVTFEPEYRVPLVYPGEHIVIEPMHAVIHEGVLYGETAVEDDVVRGPLFLPVTVDDAANQTWSWVAKFQGMRLGEYGEEVTLPNVRFQVPAGDDALDLSTVIPASQSDGTITVRGAPGPGLSDITSADGQLTFVWDNGREKSLEVPGVGSPHDLDDRGDLGDLDLNDLPFPSGIWTQANYSHEGGNYPPGAMFGTLISATPSPAQGGMGTTSMQIMVDYPEGRAWIRSSVLPQDPAEPAIWPHWSRVDDGLVRARGVSTSRALTAEDAGCAVEVNSTSARTITVPDDGEIPNGAVVEVMRRGTGEVTIEAAAGVSVLWAGDGVPKLRARYSVCTLRKRSGAQWVLHGDVVSS